MFLQAQPVRRAQWWGSWGVWELWPEHWDQWWRLLVRETDGRTSDMFYRPMFCVCKVKICAFFSVYWIAGAQVCFLVTSASFVVPLALLKTVRQLKEDWDTWTVCRDFLHFWWMLWCLQLLGNKHWRLTVTQRRWKLSVGQQSSNETNNTRRRRAQTEQRTTLCTCRLCGSGWAADYIHYHFIMQYFVTRSDFIFYKLAFYFSSL